MRNSKLIPCLLLSLLCPTALPSTRQKANQKEQPNVSFEEMRAVILEIQKKSQAARERGNLLTELDTVRALEKEYAPKGAAAQMAIATLLLTLNSFAGNYREALRFADIVQDKPAAGEAATAVPFDQLEITSGKPQPAMLLPAGDFVIEVQDPEGKPLQKFPVRIAKVR